MNNTLVETAKYPQAPLVGEIAVHCKPRTIARFSLSESLSEKPWKRGTLQNGALSIDDLYACSTVNT